MSPVALAEREARWPPGATRPDDTTNSGPYALIVAAAVVVAALLRLPFLDQQSLWLDEVFTRDIALQPNLGDVWTAVGDTESTPPLFYALEWLMVQVTGSASDAVLRLVPALAGVLTAPMAYIAVRPFAGRTVATATCWICAVSPVLVWYSLDARAYSLLVLLGLVSTWLLARALENPSRGRLAVWVVGAAAVLWTHYFGGFLVAAELAALLWLLPDARRQVLVAGGAVAVAFAPLVPLLLDQRDTRAAYVEDLPTRDRFEDTVRQFAAGLNVPEAPLEAVLIALVAGGLVAGVVAAVRRRDDRVLLVGALGAFTVLVPAGLLVLGIDRHFNMRNVLVALPCIAAVAAVGLLRARAVPLGIYLVLAVATALTINDDWRYEKVDWRSAAAEVARRAGGDPIVVEPGLEAKAATRYLGRAVATAPVASRSLWVVVAPKRTSDRELQAGVPPGSLQGFHPAETIELPHGFLLVHMTPSP